jgi:hypothetical protein
MRRLLAALRRRGSVLLVPLTMVPFAAITPTVLHSRGTFARMHESPLAAPLVTLSASERVAFPRFATGEGAIPVLTWHGIGDARDGYSVSQHAFARQLELLRSLGFHTISMRTYHDFRAGRPVVLPEHPVVLTFDDGRLDSYRGADRVLQREGMRAAMFVITGQIERKNPFYLTWSELHRMAASGRWDVEPHADAGHRLVVTDARGDTAPFYAARRFTRSGGRESMADWEARTTTDILAVRAKLAAQGFRSDTFAVPYSDVGGDPRIRALLGAFLTRQFGTYFLDADEPAWTHPGSGPASRFELHTGTSLAALYAWLRWHAPAQITTKD